MEHKAGFYIFGEFQYLLRSNKVKGKSTGALVVVVARQCTGSPAQFELPLWSI